MRFSFWRMTLHPKIQELKRRAGAISYSNVSVNERGELDKSLLDQRIVEGYAVIWGERNLHGEIFVKGAFAKSIREHGPGSGSSYEIKFLYNHNTDEPLSLFEELKEDDTGLYFRTKPLDAVDRAEQTLIQLRSGTLNNYSQGFNYIWDKMEWDEATESIIVRECQLFELSVATIPSGLTTYTVRSAEDLDYLNDETEYFIKSLPRNKQLEARQLFSRHKALANFEPSEQRTLEIDKPQGVDISYIINNF
ncbi:HK97 family phage prohead protease [Nostoc linckia]|nr:HK97 family phage prohead protease [Nostoc linckia]